MLTGCGVSAAEWAVRSFERRREGRTYEPYDGRADDTAVLWRRLDAENAGLLYLAGRHVGGRLSDVLADAAIFYLGESVVDAFLDEANKRKREVR
ncbi:MAG: hypothetical protein GF416_02495 [Candidatus Altiarchaeales archaeon]|nr:hypothetical protein [Candidatus Altiarchaeales archaeon]MBD3415989.1 hypothetical protein [Candidatus Altiarchaeales archaeon]